MTNEDILKYEKYVYGIAKKFDNYKDKDDLIQVGFLGLIMALRNYKYELNSKFTTYAYKYVYGEMCKLIREDKSIKISTSLLRLKNSIEKTKSILSQKLGRDPTLNELSDFLEIPIYEIEEALKINLNVQSIDKTINSDGKDINLYDVVPSKELDIDTLVTLKNALEDLDKDNRRMLELSLNMTEREVGEKFNISQVQVSRTLKKIKKGIRQNIQ